MISFFIVHDMRIVYFMLRKIMLAVYECAQSQSPFALTGRY
jgi:hypothetical protein